MSIPIAKDEDEEEPTQRKPRKCAMKESSDQIPNVSNDQLDEDQESLRQWSPTFLAPVTGFVEDSFPKSGRWGFRMIQFEDPCL